MPIVVDGTGNMAAAMAPVQFQYLEEYPGAVPPCPSRAAGSWRAAPVGGALATNIILFQIYDVYVLAARQPFVAYAR